MFSSSSLINDILRKLVSSSSQLGAKKVVEVHLKVGVCLLEEVRVEEMVGLEGPLVGESRKTVDHLEDVCGEIGNAQLPSSSQPSLEHVHSKEAGTLAISDLNRAINKKELILSELKHMSDGISESQKYRDNSVQDSELFKRNYASVLKQLTGANEQVSSALFFLRKHNTYQASSSIFSLKPMANFDDPSGQPSSSNCNREDDPQLCDFLEPMVLRV